jgi:hypothetical protein
MNHTFRTALTAVAVAAAVVGVGACSSSNTNSAATTTPTVTAEPTAPPTDTGPGTGTVSLGERFNIIGRDHEALGSAAFTAIEVDPDCSAAMKKYGDSGKPEHGHFIAVAMDVATTPQLDPQQFNYPTGYDFTITGPDGYTEGGLEASSSCLQDRGTFGTPFAPNRKYKGWVLLDAPAATGTLTFRPHFANQTMNPGITIAIPASGNASAAAEPSVTEDASDFAQMKANIAAHGGQPSNSAESQYLYACEQKTLPADQCP